jgi:hypothetical protein
VIIIFEQNFVIFVGDLVFLDSLIDDGLLIIRQLIDGLLHC